MPLRDANLIYCFDRSSSLSPLRPNLVLTSPIASPADWKLVGIVVAMFWALCFISSRASPLAPVLIVIVSIASSTFFHATTDAAAAAATGPVMPLVRAAPVELMPSRIVWPSCLPPLLPASFAAL